ncbi:helix-turn-helix domain-containing protein [Krasilnikovia sp. M28-CT-15]|uniref:helix-turn-helix domain-containing protein n=1 Tax=Krasilnikovia sp. M28-CT-15 TaxID=3373540 RepID=UPI00399C601F
MPVREIALRVGCHPRTVRSWIHRFNAEGLAGLDGRGRRGWPRRLTEQRRSRIVALFKRVPPGRPRYDSAAGGLVQVGATSTAAVWTLDALTEAANAPGSPLGVRRCDGSCLRMATVGAAVSNDSDLVPEGPPSSTCTPVRLRAPRSAASTSLAR